jgi:hypothetical protein
MVRLKFETIKAILTSQYWLILTLSGAFFVFFALNRGGVVVFVQLSCFFLILNALFGEYKIKKIPIFYWIACAICAYLLLVSVLLYPLYSHYRWMANLVRMMVVVFAIHCLIQKNIARWANVFFAVIISAAVCFQFAARYVFNMPHGTFTNIHYLATFVVLVLPVLFYFFWTTPGWGKIVFVLLILMDAELLLRTGSRPAFLAIIIGAVFTLFVLVDGRRRWVGVALVIFSFIALYITDYAHFATRIEDFIVHLADEERLQFWVKAWNTLKENSLTTWIFGHGIGWFPIDYTRDSILIHTFVSPHSFILEILYLNGIIGFLLVFGGLTLLLVTGVIAARHSGEKKDGVFLKCILVVYLVWLVNCGVNFPFYSKYSQYPLAFILGILFVLLERKPSRKNAKA